MAFLNDKTKERINLIISIVSLILFLITAVVIFYFSSQIAPKSMETSNTVGEAINIEITQPGRPVSSQPLLFGLNIRKYAHIILFGFLGLFGYLACGGRIKKSRFKLPISISVCLLYAVSDEFHQSFVSGRNGRIEDVFIDLAGICAGILISLIIDKLLRKHI